METLSYRAICRIKGLALLALVTFGLPAAGFESNTVPNLVLWLAADSSITTNASGVVTEWLDQSPFANDAALLGGSPTLHPTNFANGKPAIWFGGSIEALSFPAVTNIRTTLWVVNESQSASSAYRPVLGGSDTWNFHRGENKGIFGTYTPLHVRNGSVYLNGDEVGYVTPVPIEPAIIAVTTLGNAVSDQVGRDRAVSGRAWHGYIAEVLCFSHVLDAEELNTVGGYLAQKYGISTSYDIIAGARTQLVNDPEVLYQRYHTVSVSGALVDTNDAPNTAFIYWGHTDGGADPDAWQQSQSLGEAEVGPLYATLTGLPFDTVFYYTFAASNTTTNAFATSRSFRTPLFPGPWAYRTRLTTPGYSGSETLTNFPVAVTLGEHLDGFSYDQFLSPPHHDLLFVDDRSVALPYEVETWDTNGLSHIWVQLPRLRGTQETFYAYWGRAGLDARPDSTNGATWSEDYRGVWHMSETATHAQILHDSSPFANHGVFYDSQGNSTAGHSDGVIGGANFFNGDGAYVQIPHSASLGTRHVSIELWARSTPATWSANGMLLSKRNAYLIHPDVGSRSLRFFVWAPAAYSTIYTPPDIQSWRHYVATYDGITLRFYENGVQVATALGSSIVNPDPTPLYLGRDSPSAGARFLDGWLDEVRVSGVARSPDWIQASWSNQVPESTFIEAQSVEYVLRLPGMLIKMR